MKAIVCNPKVQGGEPVFEGTRIHLEFVARRLRKGESIETLLEDYPALTREDIEGSLAAWTTMQMIREP